MIIEKIEKNEFDVFLEDFESASFLQTSNMFDVLKDNKKDPEILALKKDGQILAAGLAFYMDVFGGKRLDMMNGVLAKNLEDEFEFYELLKDYAKQHGVLDLNLKTSHDVQTFDLNGIPTSDENLKVPNRLENLGFYKMDEKESALLGMPDWQYLKDLSEFMPDNYEGLLKSFNNNCQRKIKKGTELGVKIRQITRDEIEEFSKITSETADRQGFIDKSQEYYEAFYDNFGDKCEFLAAEINFTKSIEEFNDLLEGMEPSKKNMQRIASLKKNVEELLEAKENSGKDIVMLSNMILVYNKDEATYFIGGSLTDYQKFAASFLLQNEAMVRAMKKGISKYNFYGISGKLDGSDGVLRFKQNFDGYIIRKTGCYIYHPFPLKSKLISGLKNIFYKIKGK